MGSEVTYRGLKVGKVDAMHVTRSGVRLDLALEEGTEIRSTRPMYVHNLSAVGEQYLDFEPFDDSGSPAPTTATRSRAVRRASRSTRTTSSSSSTSSSGPSTDASSAR